MITRFTAIKQIGVFREATGIGGHELGKLTVFYGLNTYGKTTLKDIFLSISENNPNVLLERMSIPFSQERQEIHLTFKDNNKEIPLCFENKAWGYNPLQGKIIVFDNDFVHRNLITGLSITRENVESFSDFILGEKGVTLSEDIGKLKKQLSYIKRNMVKPDYVKSSEDKEIEDFISLKVNETTEDIEVYKAEKQREVDNLSKIEEIKKLPDIEPPKLKITDELNYVLDKINIELTREYKTDSTPFLKEIQKHISINTVGQNIESWISKGIFEHIENDNCPFCGQTLLNVKDLIKAYYSFFGEEYKKYKKDICAKLDVLKSELYSKKITISSDIHSFINSLYQYGKYETQIYSEIEQTDLTLIQTLDEKAQSSLESQKNIIRDIIELKKLEPNNVFKINIEDSFIIDIENLKKEVQNIYSKMASLVNRVKKLKQAHSLLTPDEIQKKNYYLLKDISEADKKSARLSQSNQCEKYLYDKNSIKTLENTIAAKSTELENQQSGYIKDYFDSLNYLYNKLGSNNFLLKGKVNNRGHKKVYELKMAYKNKEISSDSVSKVMSESDKRSLALAIFLTKLRQIKDRSDYIVVLDDLVVSFDDNRISNTVNIINDLLKTFKQVIVLTHYPSLIKQISLSIPGGIYFNIVQDSNTSKIDRLDIDKFLL
ncbi:hypothetical protein MBAV_001200 [Candidatus Magnetobacterium bavaricum]|uniref:Uncharacterized protein n=1 Tax=Candidatus Magnetobacterium bavaricum TaxID=29290 RepID=A0A0F3GXL8_9BACT|nr:hypothetical protein MBAV_001200 [Candidatus Magnetobacterium bavaricum]